MVQLFVNKNRSNNDSHNERAFYQDPRNKINGRYDIDQVKELKSEKFVKNTKKKNKSAGFVPISQGYGANIENKK